MKIIFPFFYNHARIIHFHNKLHFYQSCDSIWKQRNIMPNAMEITISENDHLVIIHKIIT